MPDRRSHPYHGTIAVSYTHLDVYKRQVTGFDAISQQQHQIFPAIDLNIAPQWEINFGLGVGLTGTTDHLIAKMILGYHFNF